MTFHTYNGSSWKDVTDPSIFNQAAGAFKPIIEGYVYNGSTWQQFYQRPLTPEATLNSSSSPIVCGNNVTVTGNVVRETGDVPDGYVDLYWDWEGGSSLNYIATLSLDQSTGAFSHTYQADTAGNRVHSAYFRPNTGSIDLETYTAGANVSMTLNPVSLNQGTAGRTTASVTWSAITGATKYTMYKDGVYVATATGTSYTFSGLSNDRTYSLTCYSKASPISGDLWGPVSNTRSAYTGRNEIRDTGSKSSVKYKPVKIDSWRSSGGWDALSGYFSQGYWSSSNGNYRGVVDYGTRYNIRNNLRNTLSSNYDIGTDRQLNGTCTKAEVWMRKAAGVGTSGKVSVGIKRTDSAAGIGGDPADDRHGAYVYTNSADGGDGKWMNIGTTHGQHFGDGVTDDGARSLYIRNDGAADYAKFTGGEMSLSWKWDYVTTSNINPSWK